MTSAPINRDKVEVIRARLQLYVEGRGRCHWTLVRDILADHAAQAEQVQQLATALSASNGVMAAQAERLAEYAEALIAHQLLSAETITAQADTIKSLSEALEPFKLAADNLDEDDGDGCPLWESPEAMMLTAGDLRKALAALSPNTGEQSQ